MGELIATGAVTGRKDVFLAGAKVPVHLYPSTVMGHICFVQTQPFHHGPTSYGHQHGIGFHFTAFG